jgi:hypothetical protein
MQKLVSAKEQSLKDAIQEIEVARYIGREALVEIEQQGGK